MNPDVWYSICQDDVAGCFEYFADLAESLDKRQNAPVSLPMENFKCYLRKEPIGVVGLITPWYFTFFSHPALIFIYDPSMVLNSTSNMHILNEFTTLHDFFELWKLKTFEILFLFSCANILLSHKLYLAATLSVSYYKSFDFFPSQNVLSLTKFIEKFSNI